METHLSGAVGVSVCESGARREYLSVCCPSKTKTNPCEVPTAMKVEAADITVGRPAFTSGLSLADTSCDEIPFKITCLKVQWKLELADTNLDLEGT